MTLHQHDTENAGTIATTRTTNTEAHLLQTLVSLTLVPVEVFGGCDHPGCHDQCGTFGYGLCDAVGPGYSDCNRADGKIFRVEDLDVMDPHLEYDGEQVRVQVLVREQDLEFFKRRFGDPREGRPARRCGHCSADAEAAAPS